MIIFQQVRKWITSNNLIFSIFCVVFVGLITYVPSMGGSGFYSDDYHMIYGAYTSGAEKIFENNSFSVIEVPACQ